MPDPAELLNEYGDVVTGIGNAFMHDAATSTQTEGGAVRVLEISGDFFEFMNGKLNMTKTPVAILTYDSKVQLKRKAQPCEVWPAEHHIPDKILVVNKVVRHQVRDLEAAISAGVCVTEEDKQQAAALLNKLKQAEYFEVQVLDPYDEVKYLGVWVQPAMFCKRPVAEVTKQVADALAAAAIEAWEAMPVDSESATHCDVWPCCRG